MMEIPFKHNHAEGIGHSFYENALGGDALYRGGILNGTQTGYYLNGKIKTQGEWRDGKPIGLHKLFDEQGRLEMTTDIKENIRTETHFYPDERKNPPGLTRTVNCLRPANMVRTAYCAFMLPNMQR
jgi:antitoxin component YwqK of YwqJK toxin-antitoxin module